MRRYRERLESGQPEERNERNEVRNRVRNVTRNEECNSRVGANSKPNTRATANAHSLLPSVGASAARAPTHTHVGEEADFQGEPEARASVESPDSSLADIDRVPRFEPPVVSTVSPQRIGSAMRILRECNLAHVSGANPNLIALLATDITDDELRWGGEDAFSHGKGFAYAVKAMLGQRQDAARALPPSTQPSKPAWVLEREESAREWTEPGLALLRKLNGSSQK